MKKIIHAIAVSILLAYAAVNANAIGQSIYFNNDYLIESSFDELNNVYLIKLKISADGIVKCNVTGESNNIILSLTDGEMEKGEYRIYFKPDEKYSGRKFNCIMKVYSKESGSLLYSNDIKMN